MPIPEVDQVAYARMKYEQENREKAGPLDSALDIFKRGPDVRAAAKSGQPAMTSLQPLIPASVPTAPPRREGTPGGFKGDVSAATVVETGPPEANAPAAGAPSADPAAPAAAAPAAETAGSGGCAASRTVAAATCHRTTRPRLEEQKKPARSRPSAHRHRPALRRAHPRARQTPLRHPQRARQAAPQTNEPDPPR